MKHTLNRNWGWFALILSLVFFATVVCSKITRRQDLVSRTVESDVSAPIVSVPASVAGPEAIHVFFAPCSADDTNAIDDQLVALLQGAQRSIYCAFYELQLETVAEVLREKHLAGLDVRIVSDSDYEDRDAIRACAASGIQVVFDNRSALMHDKFCVVDEAIVWTGSTNVTENCMYRNNNNALLIRSDQLAADYRVEFVEMFEGHRFGAGSAKDTPYPVMLVGETNIECYFSPDDGVQDEIIEEVRAAGRTIDFMAFSFTSAPIAEAMAERLAQGVLVRGLFEKTQARPPCSRDVFLAERGAHIYKDTNPKFMHNKVIIVDGETVVIGSYNFSDAAETKNDENALIIHSPEVAGRYVDEVERLILE